MTGPPPRVEVVDEPRARPRDWLSIAAVALVSLPFFASAISLAVRVGGSYHPWADRALLEMRVRDIGSHVELLGPYSRFHWFHPGPVLFYLLDPVYRISGSRAIGLNLGTLLINCASVVGIVLIARRRGGLPLLVLTVLLVEVLLHGVGPQFLRDDWNPYVTVLPFLLLIFLVWSMTCGATWAMPVAAGVATFLVESHVGYSALAGALFAAGLVGLLQSRPASLRKPVLWTAGVLVVLWLPVIVEQLIHDPGNLDRLYSFFRDVGSGEPLSHAVKAVTMQLSSRPDWVLGEASVPVFIERLFDPPAFPFTLVLLLGATWLAWRRARDAFRLDCIVLVALGAGIFSVTRIVGGLFPYLIRWTWALGMVVVLAALWSGLAAWRRVPQWVLVVIASGAIVLALVNTVEAASAGNPNAEFSAGIDRVSRAVLRELPPGKGVVLLRGAANDTFPVGTSAGIANELERHGVSVRVSPSLAYVYGHYRQLDHERVRLTVFLSRKRETPPGYRFVGVGVGAGVFVKPG